MALEYFGDRRDMRLKNYFPNLKQVILVEWSGDIHKLFRMYFESAVRGRERGVAIIYKVESGRSWSECRSLDFPGAVRCCERH
jgi:hypothetical protein